MKATFDEKRYGEDADRSQHENLARARGPYDSLNLGYEAIQNWMKENGEESGGAPWEVYLTDPGEVPDPAEWLTEIIHPLKSA